MSRDGGPPASGDATDPLVRVDDVAVSLGDVEALAGVSATIERGTLLGLVGPNGAGKTTLLRTINGVVAPDRGAVEVAGRDVAALSAAETGRLVATVPQETSLSFAFDVRDVVAMGRNPYVSRFGAEREADRERVRRAMARAEVARFADREVDAVSGGERQRVLLARALAQDTPLLLLDEPTASLDVNHQVRTLELVADLVAGGKTVVAAIHDLNLAAHYCDELLMLSEGSVRAAGPPEDVLTEDHLETAFDTRAAVTRHPVTGSTYVTALPDRSADRDVRVHAIAGGGTGSRLLYLLDAAGFEVTVGALNEGDSDLETARQLGLDAVATPPYAPVDPGAAGRVRERARAADVAVVADVEVGEGNLPNLEAAGAADRLVLVEERPFAERNYAGDRARAVYDGLRERATVVEPGEIVGAVEAAASSLDGRDVSAADAPFGDPVEPDGEPSPVAEEPTEQD